MGSQSFDHPTPGPFATYMHTPFQTHSKDAASAAAADASCTQCPTPCSACTMQSVYSTHTSLEPAHPWSISNPQPDSRQCPPLNSPNQAATIQVCVAVQTWMAPLSLAHRPAHPSSHPPSSLTPPQARPMPTPPSRSARAPPGWSPQRWGWAHAHHWQHCAPPRTDAGHHQTAPYLHNENRHSTNKRYNDKDPRRLQPVRPVGYTQATSLTHSTFRAGGW